MNKNAIGPLSAAVLALLGSAMASGQPTLAMPESSTASGAEASVTQLEAKWRNVMTRMKGWNEDAVQQFRAGYEGYPRTLLAQALAAPTFEGMQAILDGYAASGARSSAKAASAAYRIGATQPGDADNPQVVNAATLAAKLLGDDAKDLTFIPITPCTVWDTRFATDTNSSGIIGPTQTKHFYSHYNGSGGSYAPWGGNASCPETTQNALGNRPYAVMMTVYVSDATSNGWLTFYRDGDPDPSAATISVYYSPGPTRTQTVVSKSSRGYGTGTYDVAVTGQYGSANASASVTGYFMKAVLPAVATVMSGRVTNPGAQATCTVGAPTGLSATGACSGAGIQAVQGWVNTGRVLRNLTVKTDSNVTVSSTFYVINTTGLLSCPMAAGTSTCTAAGPASIGTGFLAIEFDSSGGIPPGVSFTYELAPQ